MRMYFFVGMLILGLALMGGTGMAVAEDTPDRMTMSQPEIRYDGTYLDVSVVFTPTEEGIALVDSNLLDPALQEEPEAREALATGATLMGVAFKAVLLSEGVIIEDRPVFYTHQEGRAFTQGFCFILSPSIPLKDLAVQIEAQLFEKANSPMLMETIANVPLPEPVLAETAYIPMDIAVDNLRAQAAFISSSKEAFCIQLLIHDGDWSLEGTYSDPAGGAPKEPLFRYHQEVPEMVTQWEIFVFDPLEALPDALDFTLIESYKWEERLLEAESITLQLDIAGESATVKE